MNNTSSHDPSQPSNESQSNPESPSAQGRCVFDPLCAAVNEGAHRARAAAEKAIPKVRAAVWGATYWLGYGVSFAAVFSYTVAKELAPEELKAGCRDGAQAGQRTAQDLAAKWDEQPSDPGGSPQSSRAPSNPATEPGAA